MILGGANYVLVKIPPKDKMFFLKLQTNTDVNNPLNHCPDIAA